MTVLQIVTPSVQPVPCGVHPQHRNLQYSGLLPVTPVVDINLGPDNGITGQCLQLPLEPPVNNGAQILSYYPSDQTASFGTDGSS